MELTRQSKFLVVLHDKGARFVRMVARTDALDLAIEAANTAKRKDGEYCTVYAEVGVSR
jgi:hypothetical protein